MAFLHRWVNLLLKLNFSIKKDIIIFYSTDICIHPYYIDKYPHLYILILHNINISILCSIFNLVIYLLFLPTILHILHLGIY